MSGWWLQEEAAADLLANKEQLELHADSESRISIFYSTAWKDAILHGSIFGGSWQDHPFQRVSKEARRALDKASRLR